MSIHEVHVGDHEYARVWRALGEEQKHVEGIRRHKKCSVMKKKQMTSLRKRRRKKRSHNVSTRRRDM